MPDFPQSPEAAEPETDLAAKVRFALETADLDQFVELLDPEVHWGAPDDQEYGCKNRRQVLAWYKRGRDKGVRAKVTEVVPHGDRLLVGLLVSGTPDATSGGGDSERWQVLSVRDGRIVDIRGFDDRAEAASRAGIPA